MADRIECPHCFKSMGGPSTDGGFKVRLGITLIDDGGRVHGPCTHCKRDVTIAEGGTLVKSLIRAERPARPAGRRRAIRLGIRVDTQDG